MGFFYYVVLVSVKIQPMENNDQLHPFIFEDSPIRGNLVHLNSTYHLALANQQLPLIVKKALGELMAASALLTSTLKMDGVLVLQIQNKGQLKLLVVECSSNMNIRATAKWDGEIAEDANFLDLVKDGQCVITLDPTEGKPYQSIVPIEGNSIAEMLENYMLRSQQLETTLQLSCDSISASGLLLQKLPELPSHDADAWNRVSILANTVTDAELNTYAFEKLIMHLFNEEDVRLFDAKPTQFCCKCTRSGVSDMLKMLGKEEVDAVLAEQKKIEVNCDYCNKQYVFDHVDAATLFAKSNTAKASKSIH
ncbi:MAG: molecular chaperone Hsp33 [Methylophilaceae bacterium]